MDNYLLISDAAKEVEVESHVLRYWEEELHLPIKRNELGHRYYTREDVERFKQIKSMKERGLQLKAIKMVLKDGKLDVIPQEAVSESREEKAQRLQWILQQMIRQAVRENNEEVVQQVKESVLKELDYQFRMQEEREEERARQAAERTESYYRQIDELLRNKSHGSKPGLKSGKLFGRGDDKDVAQDKPILINSKREKKKRRFNI
ncbi:MAG: helix-turn-helix domain-containing protein [Clostridium sp.]|nr:helix-turn-helix domain-containing protein [Acetatifactor muris]MCM1525793.1 helix-turn-helix domain-containing protein [Bacteroides sp.]MCM1564049.1 helix-turn-helix domain-containing protein [Clostridium sp.]